MTREEILKKIDELSPEQKEFLKQTVKEHSLKAKENSRVSKKENKEKLKNKI